MANAQQSFYNKYSQRTNICCCFKSSKPFIYQQTLQNYCFFSLLVKITPLQSHNKTLFLLWLNLTCMMGIIGREGFQLLSVSVTDKQGDGTMGRRPFSPSDCLVVKPTAGVSDDKRRVSIISRKGHFGDWFKEKELEWQKGQWGLHKEMEGAGLFSQNGAK